MGKFLLGKKIGMSQIFRADGNAVPVTVIQAGPMTVIREKTDEKDGYATVQFGFGARRAKNVAKPQREEWKGLGSFEAVRESRSHSGKGRGETVDLTQFREGDIVKVSGISKAKGFQGVVKRHGFHGAPKTHGTKHAHREPGSIGATWPQRVIKGRRMAGRMGGERVTVRNLEVVKIDPETQILALKGAVPGRRGTLLEIRS
ncbi:MAG: 50S ribosomal protein L3 [Candidatus Sungbacteria bacterium]|uniref:Large ribosomal subunit protein uL3 n=1 Tax=Candidatus Sungiibacteriota bacterium TaxID=2750080 RepID=A0A933DRU9_9BACT|nr:50S ribosomal protein L3 [Candidatus Sungbacteria bacterium]